MHVTTFRSNSKKFAGQNACRSLSGSCLRLLQKMDQAHSVVGDPVGQTPWGLEPALSANSTQSDQSAASLRMLSRAARRAVEHSAVGYDLGDTKPEQVRLGHGKQRARASPGSLTKPTGQPSHLLMTYRDGLCGKRRIYESRLK
jgi:hypothetical protein